MDIAERFVPKATRRSLVRWWRSLARRPRLGRIDFGDLRRLRPISAEWGYDRGMPIDRFYIDRFLSSESEAVRGRVLEIGSPELTHRYGDGRVSRSDVLHVADARPPVTILGNLATGEGIQSNAFDCAIVTQTLQFIYDIHGVVQTLHRMLAPGGTALVTVPGVSRISRYDMDRWGQYWCFTTRSARQLFEEAFAPANVRVHAYGNVLAATAFLQGVAAEELDSAELLDLDPDFETLIAIRAQKEA